MRIESDRNVKACRVLEGKPLAQVPVLVPLLFSVCGRAQWAAALAACEQAENRVPPAAEPARRQLLVLAETAREHGRRILLDWPGLCGELPAPESVKRLQQSLQGIESVVGGGGRHWQRDGKAAIEPFAEALFDILLQRDDTEMAAANDFLQLATWCQRTCNPAAALIRHVIDRGLECLGRSDVRPLPVLDPVRLDEVLAADHDGEYVARPRWNGAVYETGPSSRMQDHPLALDLGRRFGNGLLMRLALQLAELIEIPKRMRATLAAVSGGAAATTVGAGIGVGLVEAARGQLVHRIEAHGGHVRRYQILAPTEWNLHPQGPLAKGLLGLPVRDKAQLRHQAAMLVTALDPCVAYDMEIL